MVHSDRSKHAYLNPMSDSRIRSRRGFADGGDGVCVCLLFYTGFQSDLRSFYILSILLLLSYLSFTFTSGLSCPDRIVHGWEYLYSVRPHTTQTFLYDCLFWDPLFDSSIFSRCGGVSHFTGSCRVPYRLLCQVQVLYILEFGCNFIPYSLEVFLV